MKGGEEFCSLFRKAEQHGQLYLLPGEHARGKTFRIYVLPRNEDVIENAGINPPLNKGAVEVYGVTSGNPGWTEAYGWLHEGQWVADFNGICERRRDELNKSNLADKEARMKLVEKESSRVQALLSDYRGAK